MHDDPYPHRCAGAAAPGRARADGLRLQAHGDRLLLHPPTGAAARRGGESRSSDRAAAWRVSVYGAPGVMTRHSSSRGKSLANAKGRPATGPVIFCWGGRGG
eukprot:scaffold113302_cov63-Phaeocystis_antarctica.AAC.1